MDKLQQTALVRGSFAHLLKKSLSVGGEWHTPAYFYDHLLADRLRVADGNSPLSTKSRYL